MLWWLYCVVCGVVIKPLKHLIPSCAMDKIYQNRNEVSSNYIIFLNVNSIVRNIFFIKLKLLNFIKNIYVGNSQYICDQEARLRIEQQWINMQMFVLYLLQYCYIPNIIFWYNAKCEWLKIVC